MPWNTRLVADSNTQLQFRSNDFKNFENLIISYASAYMRITIRS